MSRKVCVVVASRANYGRVKYVMKAIQEHTKLQLQLIVGASTLLERFGSAIEVIKEDGFLPDKIIHYIIEGSTPTTTAKSTGLGIIELSTAFDDLKPDMVLSVADRFETMSTAVAATYSNIPLIHLQGGEVSGNIDDRVRHAITKLADYHFVASEDAKKRVLKMGEEKFRVFNHGCPAMDVLKNTDLTIDNAVMSQYGGVGVTVDWCSPYILMIQHPVTTSYGDGYEQVEQILEALKHFKGYQKIILWPNGDAGSDDVSKGIRVFRESNLADNFHFFKNFSPEDFSKVINNSVCNVGNSSAFLRECAFLGSPSVLVGDRQQQREHGDNVVFSNYNSSEIQKAITTQINNGKYTPNYLFGSGMAGVKIVEELVKINLNSFKRNSY